MKNANPPSKASLKQFKDELKIAFLKGESLINLMHQLINWVDAALISLFKKSNLDKGHQCSLLALGSYGRRELLLHSDIDLLVLYREDANDECLNNIQLFIQQCWDMGLQLSHQMTTINALAALANNDLTVMSSLMDAHLICGSEALMETLRYKTHAIHMWPSELFYQAKKEEQDKRLIKYGDTAYNLEPNVKNGPGGLRDLQIIFTIAKRHFGVSSLSKAMTEGFISEKEYETLIECQHFLWRIRFALHCFADKQQERLIFDSQQQLATFFGFHDNKDTLAVEQFMKVYFNVIKKSRALNEIILQWFSETIVYHQKQRIESLDNTFQLSNDYIEIKHPIAFTKYPLQLIILFHWILKRKDIKGIRANTIRLIERHLFLINPQFLNAPATTHAFLELFKNETPPFMALQWMNRLGILGRYLEAFSQVTGQMQYDLFHVFTVDQHTLFVIRNLGRFLSEEYQQTFPLCYAIMKTLKKPYCLYLAALFHDIAKGRGGDHAILGAKEVALFSKRHHLNNEDTTCLIWLVKNHLLLSETAQRRDIYSPKTIAWFLNQLPHPDYLDYLYLLTVADICATNPALWNAWKDALLKELYQSCQKALKDEKTALNETLLIKAKKQSALKSLTAMDYNDVEKLWAAIKPHYFLQESPQTIAQHTEAILNSQTYPLILIHPHHTGGGTEVMIYMPHCDERFSIATTLFTNHQLTIQEAFISTCQHNYDLDTYIILDNNHRPLHDEKQIAALKLTLKTHLAENHSLPRLLAKRQTKAQAHFKFQSRLQYGEEDDAKYTRLFLVACDHPGLLATISRVFLNLSIHLHSAKIVTVGERAEDMFYLSNPNNEALSEKEKQQLSQAVILALD